MNLSGGQKQKLILARCLLKHPELLILDEATSNLDSVSEMQIKSSLSETAQDMACIIIAHRLNTIKECNRIYVINHGSIVECGTHEDLIKNNGKYYEMWKSQNER